MSICFDLSHRVIASREEKAMNIRGFVLAAVTAVLLAAPAHAHHSFAMFQATKKVTVTGTVKEFEWINPHVWVHLQVTDDETGKSAQWSFEAGSTGQLSASGWKSDTLKPGDKISLSFHPLKDGSFGGQLLDVTLADGTTLCQGAACRAAARD
jgi:hypothetical protein